MLCNPFTSPPPITTHVDHIPCNTKNKFSTVKDNCDP